MAGCDLPRGAGPDGARVVAMLRKLAELTGDGAGAQRVAWTDVWQRARAFLREQLRGLPVTVGVDAAGNQWARLPGGGGGVVVIGSHLDSVPDGGWLDGAYGVMCAVEVLRSLAAGGPLPCTVALVEWADEEGARFGHSLFGSSRGGGDADRGRGPRACRCRRVAAGRRGCRARCRPGSAGGGAGGAPRCPGLPGGAHRAGAGAGTGKAWRSARCPGRWASSVTG